MKDKQARSSAGPERFLDTEEVDGSNPFGPTIVSPSTASLLFIDAVTTYLLRLARAGASRQNVILDLF